MGQPVPDREGRRASSPRRTRRPRSCSPTGRRSRSRNARLYRTVRERRDELERTIRGLETTTEISRALGGVTDLDRVLELVVKRSRALVDARAAEIALLEGDEFVIAAVGRGGRRTGCRARGCRSTESLAAAALRTGPPQRFDRDPAGTVRGARSSARARAIVTPMIFRNRPVGLPGRVRPARRATGRSTRRTSGCCRRSRPARRRRWRPRRPPSEEALRRSIEASEAERDALGARAARRDAAAARRAARAAVRRAPQRRRRRGSRGAIDDALEQITTAIGDLRALITDLRPAALDELGAQAGARDAGRARSRGRPTSRSTSTSTSPTSAATPARHATRSSRPSTGSCRRR